MINENKIKESSWLNESQKQRLLAVYRSVSSKDIADQALTFLGFGPDSDFHPCEYKNMVVSLMEQLHKISGTENGLLPAYGEMLHNLYFFFDVLDCDSFDVLCAIKDAYSGPVGRDIEKQVNGVYASMVNQTKDKLQILETI